MFKLRYLVCLCFEGRWWRRLPLVRQELLLFVRIVLSAAPVCRSCASSPTNPVMTSEHMNVRDVSIRSRKLFSPESRLTLVRLRQVEADIVRSDWAIPSKSLTQFARVWHGEANPSFAPTPPIKSGSTTSSYRMDQIRVRAFAGCREQTPNASRTSRALTQIA